MSYYVGVDIGGTFTDGVVLDSEGRTLAVKTPTTPADPALGLLDCLQLAAEQLELPLEAFLGQVAKLAHGTTIATNLVLQGGGARTGLLVTKGTRDTLIMEKIGREYLGLDVRFRRATPLVPRALTLEINERVDRYGAVLTPLNLDDVRQAARRLVAEEVEAVAICFLWSFRNPAHEQQARALILEEFPGLAVSASHEVAPLLGEFERMATTAINVSIAPRVSGYLQGVADRLAARGLAVPLLIMQSGGGLVPSAETAARPVAIISSGPTGGIVACQHLGRLLDQPNILGIDMGGTSFDASLITDGQPETALSSRVGNYPVLVPVLKTTSIGAGGGSIAWLDLGTRLKVGPRSAGAEPGPACYGRGGTQPTVTDADVALGYVNPEYFLGGRIRLDKDAAWRALDQQIARPLGMSVVEAAAGIREIVDQSMADTLRTLTVSRGKDPRDYLMVAFGGAGPVHAAALCDELGLDGFVVPSMASVHSAFGIVASDVLHVFSTSEVLELDDVEAINRALRHLCEQGRAQLHRDGFRDGEVRLIPSLEVRFKGQAHALGLTLEGEALRAQDRPELVRRFHEQYEAQYGRATIYRGAEMEIATLRVDAVGATPRPDLRPRAPRPGLGAPAPKLVREVYFRELGGFYQTPIYAGAALEPGHRIEGPAVIEQEQTTVVIGPGQVGSVDSLLNVVVRR